MKRKRNCRIGLHLIKAIFLVAWEWHTGKSSREEARHARMCGGHMVPCNAHTWFINHFHFGFEWLMAFQNGKRIHLPRRMIVSLCLHIALLRDTTRIKEEEMEPLLCFHHQLKAMNAIIGSQCNDWKYYILSPTLLLHY